MLSFPKRILFIIDELGPGGAERQLVELVRGLPSRYEIHLVMLNNKRLHYIKDISPYCKDVIIFHRKCKIDIFPVLRIVHYCKKNRIDIIQSFLPLASFYAILVRIFYWVPLVCCAIRDAKDNSWKKMLLIKISCMASTICIANSEAGFTNRFSKISSKMRVIYNGFDLKRIPGLMKAKKPQASSLVIAMAASFTSHKDHETLIFAFASLCRSYDIFLYLFGEGERQSMFEELVKTLGIDDRVVFKGFVTNILEEFSAVDIAVLATNTDVHEEGISNSLVEAMAMGIPVIATRGGGTNEVITDRITGILVDNKNIGQLAAVLEELIVSPRIRGSLAVAGQEFVIKHFSYEAFLKKYIGVYESILEPYGDK